MQGKKRYQEKLFTNFQLSDRVPEDNFYRRLKVELDMGWLYKSTAEFYGSEGQQSIDPVVFFKLLLIGYLENIGSDRRIINTVSMRLDMLYFIGYDIDEPLPWHSTLSRTRQLYSPEVFKELFLQVLKQCIKKGMVSGHRQVIDSVFVKANASMDSLEEQKILEAGELYVASLKEEDEPGDDPGNNQAAGSNKTHSSSSDGDARMSTKPGKPTQLNYLSQVSVDGGGKRIITNIEAHHANKRDSECLPEVVAHTVENLEAALLEVKEVVADSSYSSAPALEYLEDKGVTGYIPNLGPYKKEREGFMYDQQLDVYSCSQGAKLAYKETVLTHSNRYKKVYLSSREDCSGCPLRAACIGEKAKALTKKITVTRDKPLYDRMHERMQTVKGNRMMKFRQCTVEPVLGTLINFMGMRRVNTRGIDQADKCMLMAAIAYNLKKLLKFCAPKTAEPMKMIRKWHQQVLESLFISYKQWYNATT